MVDPCTKGRHYKTTSLRILSFILIALLIPFINGSEVFAKRPVVTNVLQSAGFPFSDGFENSTLGPNWASSTTNNGTVEISTDYPHTGTRSVFLGQRLAGDASANLILAIDLTGQTDVFLDFWWRASGTALNTSNGIYISDNEGVNWKFVATLNDGSQSYGRKNINIAAAAAANNLTLNNRFRIRIFFDSFNRIANDGLIIDDLQLNQRSEFVTTFPLALADFEGDVFSKGFYPQSSRAGTAQIATDMSPYSGTRSVFLGQRVAGDASADLVLAVDLTGQTDVFLNFWWRASGKASEFTNGVYVSDNDGENWKFVTTLDDNSQSYGRRSVNIAGAAAANNLTLNNRFRIRISFQSFNRDASDGLIIDDLRLVQRADVVATFPIALKDFETEGFVQGFDPQSRGIGTSQIATNTSPRSGVRSLFLGQRVNGSGRSELVLAVNLNGLSTVYLDFWWRASGKAADPNNGIYLSDNDGVTWKFVRSLTSNTQQYTRQTLDIASLAANNALTLNERFRIRISFNSFEGSANDGLIIDDLSLGAENPLIGLRIYMPLARR
jgi:hypothetical protein